MKYGVGSLLAIALMMAVPAKSFAQVPAAGRQRIEGSGGDPKKVRAALERFRPVGSGTRGTPLKATPRPKQELTGRLMRGGLGEALLERVVDAQTASQLERMGYRLISSEKEISDRTILGNKVYVLYEMDKDAFLTGKEVRGVEVKYMVRHDAKGTPIVSMMRRVER